MTGSTHWGDHTAEGGRSLTKLSAICGVLLAGCAASQSHEPDGERPTCSQIAHACHEYDAQSATAHTCHLLGHAAGSSEEECIAQRDACIAACSSPR